MKMTCPSCGCAGDAELFAADMEWRKALTHALKLPSDCGPLAGRYVKLFAPLKRNLSSARACKLLQEISELVLAEEITLDRTSYRIPSRLWAQALQIMLDKQDLQRPMPNHNYLKKVAIGLLNKHSDIKHQEQHQHRRSEARVNSTVMTRVGALISDQKTKPDPLEQLSPEDREKAIQEAKQVLLDEGFQENFLGIPLIENKAREMLEVSNESN